MRRSAILAGAAALLGATTAQANGIAVVFPPTEIGLQVGGDFAFGPGFVRVGNDEAIGSLTVGGPSITAEGSTPPAGFSSQSVDATATWDFKILGPTIDPVGIIISGVYSATANGRSGTVANVFVGDNFRDYANVFTKDCSSGFGDCSQHPFSIQTSVQANFYQQIELHVGGAVNGAQGDFSVTLDPIITLAPGFAEQGYTLYVAPDAQPPATVGVPEPASWALMIGGFGLAGSMLRRKRAVATAA